MRRKIASYTVPLLNKGVPRLQHTLSQVAQKAPSPQEIGRLNDRFAVVKPERVMGAPYISEKVELRRPVNLCPACWRKYGGWWKANDYKPDWGYQWRTNCDGCSIKMILCNSFYPEENFYRIMTEAYGREPNPNKTIYFET